LSTDKNKKKGYTQGERALFHSWSMPRVLKKFSYVKCRHVYSILSRHKPGSYSRHEKLAQSSGAMQTWSICQSERRIKEL
jgi:hypothetical protein